MIEAKDYIDSCTDKDSLRKTDKDIVRKADKDIVRKALELAIDLRYLVADGTLNDPKFAISLAFVLEQYAEAERGNTGNQLP